MIVRPKGSVIIPRHPLSIAGLLGWAREINKTVQQLRDRVFDVPPSAAAIASDPFHPFKLTTWKEGETLKYEVGKGGIQDGTNGDAIDLSAVLEEEKVFTEAGYVVIEADVDSGLALTGWVARIAANPTDATNGAQEVRYTTGSTIRQDKLRLLIGKITMSDDPEPVPTAWQAQFTSVMITQGVHNGMLVKNFKAAPTAAEDI